MKINEIIESVYSVRVKGDNFTYIVRKSASRSAGTSMLMLDLPDVDGELMPCDVISNANGSFE